MTRAARPPTASRDGPHATILLTSIGSLSAVSLLMCLEPVRRQVRIVATNSIAEAAGNFLADRTVLVPPTAQADAWMDVVKRIIQEERPNLVLNGRDEELPLLGLLRDQLEAGTHCLVPPASAAMIFNDKLVSASFAAERALPFADTACTPEDVESLLTKHGLPLMVKPRHNGTGSKGAFLALHEADLQSALNAGTYVFQEVLPCPVLEASLGDWRQLTGAPRAWLMQSLDHEIDLLLDDGVVACCLSAGHNDGAYNRDLQIVEAPEMKYAAAVYAEALLAIGYLGPVNLQGRLIPDRGFVPFELNARFTGTCFGKAMLGYNLVLEAVRHWCGIGVDAATSMAPSGKAVQRAPLFLSYDVEAASALAATGDWSAP